MKTAFSGLNRILRSAALAAALANVQGLAMAAQTVPIEQLYEQIDDLVNAGNSSKALPLARKALEIQQKALKPNDPDLAIAFKTLASVQLETDDLVQAEQNYLRALKIFETADGTDEDEVIECLTGLTSLYKQSKNFNKAIDYQGRVLEATRKQSGDSSMETADQLSELADIHASAGQEAQAVQLFEKALSIYRKQKKAEDGDYVETLQRYGSLLQDKSNFQKAEVLYSEAVKVANNGGKKSINSLLDAMNSLASLYEDQTLYRKAENIYRQTLEISEKNFGIDHKTTAEQLENLGSIHISLGQTRDSIKYYQRACKIYEKSPESQEDLSSCLGDLGDAYSDMGEYKQADEFYQKSFSIISKLHGRQSYEAALHLSALSSNYQDRGDNDQAERLAKEALEITEATKGKDSPEAAGMLELLASQYQLTGQPGKAEPLLRRALEINLRKYGADDPNTVNSLVRIGGLLELTDREKEAIDYYEKALTISRKSSNARPADTANLLRSLGLLHISKQPERAERLLSEALSINEKISGHDSVDVASNLSELGRLHVDLGNNDKAVSIFRRALEIRRKVLGSEHEEVAESLRDLGRLAWKRKSLQEATGLLAQAQDIEEKNFTRLILQASEEKRKKFMERLDVDQDISFSIGNRSPAAINLGATAVLRMKGRILDASAENLTQIRKHLDPASKELLDQLRKVASALSNLGLKPPQNMDEQSLQERKDELSKQKQELENKLLISSGNYQQMAKPVMLQDVQKAIPANHVLVEWFRYEPYNPDDPYKEQDARYAAFLLDRDHAPSVVDLGPAAAIEQVVTTWRNEVRVGAGPARSPHAQALFALIMKPLSPAIRQLNPAPARLLLAPDSALNLIPLGAMVDDQGRFLADLFEIGHLNSGRDLLRINGSASTSKSVTVIAAPDYDPLPVTAVASAASAGLRGGTPPAAESGQRSAGKRVAVAGVRDSGLIFTPLAGTAGEASMVKSLYPGAQVLTGRSAQEASMKDLKGPTILHVATHGFFLNDLPTVPRQRKVQSSSQPARPAPVAGLRHRGTVEIEPVVKASVRPANDNPLLRAGLALAGANGSGSGESGGEDGIITAAEVAELNLQGTQLVVLSACETGTGEVAKGEGVYGLRRALVLAGAQTQVLSLWKVSDAATERLMAEFYRRLRLGENRTQALRSAQALLRGQPDTEHPYFWAAFISIGDWRPLDLR